MTPYLAFCLLPVCLTMVHELSRPANTYGKLGPKPNQLQCTNLFKSQPIAAAALAQWAKRCKGDLGDYERQRKISDVCVRGSNKNDCSQE